MPSLNEISEMIREQFKGVQQKIQALKKQSGDQKFQNANKHQKQLARINELIQTYDFTIKDNENDDNIEIHESQLKQYRKKLKTLDKELEYNRNEQVDQNQLFKNRSNNKDAESSASNRQQLFQKGHRVQEDTYNTAINTRNMVIEMNAKADTINVELDRQINMLDSIYDNMKDTETTLKRAEKHLRYFARQVYTDRLMICLIVIIVLAIIVIIILKIIGKTPQVSVDQLK